LFFENFTATDAPNSRLALNCRLPTSSAPYPRANCFRMNTYEKEGEGGGGGQAAPPAGSAGRFHCFNSLRTLCTNRAPQNPCNPLSSQSFACTCENNGGYTSPLSFPVEIAACERSAEIRSRQPFSTEHILAHRSCPQLEIAANCGSLPHRVVFLRPATPKPISFTAVSPAALSSVAGKGALHVHHSRSDRFGH